MIISIIYAFRDRDEKRVELSLQSLERQTNQNFEVVFVDYGSRDQFALPVKNVIEKLSFAKYYYIAHEGLLWNKSKALNFGLRVAKGEYVFIADVDIIFHSNSTNLFESLIGSNTAILFSLSYLSHEESNKTNKGVFFEDLVVSHTGNVNGMVLAPKKAIENVHGLDEFFHFYGSEDVDLFERLKQSGLEIINCKELYFKHLWHPIYNLYNDSKMSNEPRLYNIKRINQQHFFNNKNRKITIPSGQEEWGKVISKEGIHLLKEPDEILELSNVDALVKHFFEEEINNYKDVVLKVIIEEDDYYDSFNYRLKLLLKRQTQPYMSMKAVNDLVLSKIVYVYRDFNYCYQIDDDFKRITFVIHLKN